MLTVVACLSIHQDRILELSNKFDEAQRRVQSAEAMVSQPWRFERVCSFPCGDPGEGRGWGAVMLALLLSSHVAVFFFFGLGRLLWDDLLWCHACFFLSSTRQAKFDGKHFRRVVFSFAFERHATVLSAPRSPQPTLTLYPSLPPSRLPPSLSSRSPPMRPPENPKRKRAHRTSRSRSCSLPRRRGRAAARSPAAAGRGCASRL